VITAVEVREFMGLTSPDTFLAAVVDQATAATNELFAQRCGEYLPVAPWPPDLIYAALLQASRLVKRRASPEGVAGMGDFGPVRISVMDPDIEQMISSYLWISFA
jgi:hypothetical protein